MTAAGVSSIVSEVQGAGDTILGLLEAFDPNAEIPDEQAAGIVDEVANMATKALAAWSAAAGTPITAESVLALLPNATPLTAPDQPS